MSPALFALFTRSLREDARSRALVWVRAGMAVVILFVMFQFRAFRFSGAPGRDFFASIVALNVILICIATLGYFAGAITEEKEDGTLSLLRMTNLNPLTILLGKSSSRLCGGLLLLLVQFPFALLAVTLGGLRWEQVAACYAILGAFLFFCANAGLLGSILARRTPGAAVIAACIAVAFLEGGEFAREVFNFFAHFELLSENWQAGHPVLAGIISSWKQISFGKAVGEVLYNQTAGWSPLETIVLLTAGGCATFLLAWILFERFCGEDSAVSATRRAPWPLRWMGFFRPRNRGRAWAGTNLQALTWKDFHLMHGGWRIARAKSVIYVFGALWLLYLKASANPANWDFSWGRFFLALWVLSVAVVVAESVFAASRIFRIERNQRTLSSLAALPHNLRELVMAKRRAVLLSLLPAGAIFFITSAICTLRFLAGQAIQPRTYAFGASMPGIEFFYLIMTVVWIIGQIFLNLRLAAWFSLLLRWGGLPFALTLSYFGNLFATVIMAFMFHQGVSVTAPLVTWILAVLLKHALRRRLELAASEG